MSRIEVKDTDHGTEFSGVLSGTMPEILDFLDSVISGAINATHDSIVKSNAEPVEGTIEEVAYFVVMAVIKRCLDEYGEKHSDSAHKAMEMYNGFFDWLEEKEEARNEHAL